MTYGTILIYTFASFIEVARLNQTTFHVSPNNIFINLTNYTIMKAIALPSLGPVLLQVAGNLLALEQFDQFLGGALLYVNGPRQLGTGKFGEVEVGIAMRERRPDALNGRLVGVPQFAVAHLGRVPVLILQIFYPFRHLIPVMVPAVHPISVPVYWKNIRNIY